MSNYADVGNFHLKFGLPAFEVGPDTDNTHEEYKEMLRFRFRFLLEELEEFAVGADKNDHAQMFDALLDLVYVALGTAHLLGYPWQDGWNLVQKANMAKMRASGADDPLSKRKNSLDVVKPEGWIPPDISGLLKKYGFE